MNTTFEKASAVETKTEWLTPPHILNALGEFDLDPCSPVNRPWPTAKNHFTIEDDGLSKKWFGRVWCNPPYGEDDTERFMKRMKRHNNGIALLFARTETKLFFHNIWYGADSVFFLFGRLKFYNIDGTQADNAGAPSVLIAYGKENSEILKNCGLQGKYIQLK